MMIFTCDGCGAKVEGSGGARTHEFNCSANKPPCGNNDGHQECSYPKGHSGLHEGQYDQEAFLRRMYPHRY